MFCKKAFLKFHKIRREISVLQSNSNTVKGLQDIKLVTLLKRDPCTGVSEPAVPKSSTNNSRNSQKNTWVGVSFYIKFRSRHSQMFFKIIILKNFEILQECTCVRVFFNKVAGPQNCNFTKKRLQVRFFPVKFAKYLRKPCFTESPVAASDSFRFPACNFIKRKTPAKMFFSEFCKTFKNIFWQNTFGWLLLVFSCEFWEVFQGTSFIEHLWEIAYFMYKFQYRI